VKKTTSYSIGGLGLLFYKWKDDKWMNARKEHNALETIHVYEVHLGSWKRHAR
jgi:1,4-alpha-glucan branching enzyme